MLAGVIWIVGEFVVHREWTSIGMLGASGGVYAVLILFCLNFPHQLIYIYGVFPIPAWVLAVVYLGMNLMGAMGQAVPGGSNVAFTAHLGGALFALLYFQSGMRLDRFLPSGAMLKQLQAKPKLRVHDPESTDVDDTEAAVDEILKKIQEHGRDSLTRKERRILEDASREYQKRRN